MVQYHRRLEKTEAEVCTPPASWTKAANAMQVHCAAGCCALAFLQVAALLKMTSHQQQQQQQQQQHSEALASCTVELLAAASALLSLFGDAPPEQQAAEAACISADLLQPLAAALQQTARQVEAAEAAVASALAAGEGLPAPYNRQSPSPLLKLADALVNLFNALCYHCWPCSP
jgi:cytochrome bd-type quinol oxidase subunit 2